jgi:sugar transferase (PEP-CTERM/EpsH1 system associated)
MRILYLTHGCPYPPNRGDRIRCYHILTHLAKKHEMTLVYPVFDEEHGECQEHLRRYCESVIPVRHYKILSYISCLTALFRTIPLSIAYFYSSTLAKILQPIIPDLVIADCSTMAQYAMPMAYPKILDFVDIDSQKWNHFASMARFPTSLVYRIEARRLAQYEQLLAGRFNHCLVTSRHEQSVLGRLANTSVLANGVDQQYFSPRDTPTDGSIIFTGVMNYFPNSDAALYFHRRIFPTVRREVPSTRFIIAGMHPTAPIRDLASQHTVVTGFVPDIRDYLAKAAVCVVPLRIAMGIQNKILEAMAMGVPVVTTSIANRGIQATHGKEILVADDPGEFAATTIALLNDHGLRETIAENARSFIERHFNWENNLQKLDQLIAEATSLPAAR